MERSHFSRDLTEGTVAAVGRPGTSVVGREQGACSIEAEMSSGKPPDPEQTEQPEHWGWWEGMGGWSSRAGQGKGVETRTPGAWSWGVGF